MKVVQTTGESVRMPAVCCHPIYPTLTSHTHPPTHTHTDRHTYIHTYIEHTHILPIDCTTPPPLLNPALIASPSYFYFPLFSSLCFSFHFPTLSHTLFSHLFHRPRSSDIARYANLVQSLFYIKYFVLIEMSQQPTRQPRTLAVLTASAAEQKDDIKQLIKDAGLRLVHEKKINLATDLSLIKELQLDHM